MLEAFEHKHPTLKLVLLRASAGSSAVNLLCMILCIGMKRLVR